MTGICAAQGSLQDPQIVYGSVVDYYAAALLALQVSAALVERQRTGRGCEISVSLLQASLAMQSARLVWADGEPRDIARDMRPAASRVFIRRRMGIFTYRPTHRTSGRRCVASQASTIWQMTRVMQVFVNAHNTLTN